MPDTAIMKRRQLHSIKGSQHRDTQNPVHRWTPLEDLSALQDPSFIDTMCRFVVVWPRQRCLTQHLPAGRRNLRLFLEPMPRDLLHISRQIRAPIRCTSQPDLKRYSDVHIDMYCGNCLQEVMSGPTTMMTPTKSANSQMEYYGDVQFAGWRKTVDYRWH